MRFDAAAERGRLARCRGVAHLAVDADLERDGEPRRIEPFVASPARASNLARVEPRHRVGERSRLRLGRRARRARPRRGSSPSRGSSASGPRPCPAAGRSRSVTRSSGRVRERGEGASRSSPGATCGPHVSGSIAIPRRSRPATRSLVEPAASRMNCSTRPRRLVDPRAEPGRALRPLPSAASTRRARRRRG